LDPSLGHAAIILQLLESEINLLRLRRCLADYTCNQEDREHTLMSYHGMSLSGLWVQKSLRIFD